MPFAERFGWSRVIIRKRKIITASAPPGNQPKDNSETCNDGNEVRRYKIVALLRFIVL